MKDISKALAEGKTVTIKGQGGSGGSGENPCDFYDCEFDGIFPLGNKRYCRYHGKAIQVAALDLISRGEAMGEEE